MKKKIVAAAVSALLILVVVASLGVSNTGLFHLSGIQREPSLEEETLEKNKWDLVGNVSVRRGGVSDLGT